MGLSITFGQLLLYHTYAHHESVIENHLEKFELAVNIQQLTIEFI